MMASSISVPYDSLDLSNETTVRRRNGRGYVVGAIIFVVITAIIIIALGVPLGLINEKYRSSSSSASTSTMTCLTPECVKLAASVLAAIDQTVDPCTDFYKFSCGNWIQNTVIPPGEFTSLPCIYTSTSMQGVFSYMPFECA